MNDDLRIFNVTFRNTNVLVVAQSAIEAVDFARLYLSPVIGQRERPLLTEACKRDLEYAKQVDKPVYFASPYHPPYGEKR